MPATTTLPHCCATRVADVQMIDKCGRVLSIPFHGKGTRQARRDGFGNVGCERSVHCAKETNADEVAGASQAGAVMTHAIPATEANSTSR